MGSIDKNPEKCSAVATMERGMPDFDYSDQVEQLRGLIIAEIKANPEKFSKEDVQKCYYDNWFVARYLLRTHLDLNSAHQLMSKSLEYRNSPANSIKEFPAEFYKIGGIFDYEPDRKGNIPVYIRTKYHRKVPIIQDYLKSFVFNTIETADKKAGGKGIVLILDLQGVGVNNVDMDLLLFVVTSLVNYYPKGISYILVNELPWFLRSFWVIVKKWLAEDHKELVKFSDSQTIYEYIKEENLPDFLGGTCKRDYRAVPSTSITITQAAKRWDINEDDLLKIKKKFADLLPLED